MVESEDYCEYGQVNSLNGCINGIGCIFEYEECILYLGVFDESILQCGITINRSFFGASFTLSYRHIPGK